MTNYEKIKNMSINEMANFFVGYIACDVCENFFPLYSEGDDYFIMRKYLESEAK